jgi:hypothetical protein
MLPFISLQHIFSHPPPSHHPWPSREFFPLSVSLF